MSMATKSELMRAEGDAWNELMGLVERLSAAQLEQHGYYPDWSVKDLLAHIGCWAAESQCVLEQLRMGTYTPREIDVDAMNREFYEANRDQPLFVAKAELWSSRTRMLEELNLLPELSPTAEEWFVESGSTHYAEHVPRLREWVGELHGAG